MKRNIIKHENWFRQKISELEECVETLVMHDPLFENVKRTSNSVVNNKPSFDWLSHAKQLLAALSANIESWKHHKEFSMTQEEYYNICSLVFCGNSMAAFVLKHHSKQRIGLEAHFWNHEIKNLESFFTQGLHKKKLKPKLMDHDMEVEVLELQCVE